MWGQNPFSYGNAGQVPFFLGKGMPQRQMSFTDVNEDMRAKYRQGCDMFVAGNYQQAEQFFNTAIKLFEELARHQRTVNDDELEADMRYKFAYSIWKAHPLHLTSFAGIIINQCDRVLEKHSTNSKTRILKARLLLVQGKHADATELAKSVKQSSQFTDGDIMYEADSVMKEAEKEASRQAEAWLQGTNVPPTAAETQKAQAKKKKKKKVARKKQKSESSNSAKTSPRRVTSGEVLRAQIADMVDDVYESGEEKAEPAAQGAAGLDGFDDEDESEEEEEETDDWYKDEEGLPLLQPIADPLAPAAPAGVDPLLLHVQRNHGWQTAGRRTRTNSAGNNTAGLDSFGAQPAPVNPQAQYYSATPQYHMVSPISQPFQSAPPFPVGPRQAATIPRRPPPQQVAPRLAVPLANRPPVHFVTNEPRIAQRPPPIRAPLCPPPSTAPRPLMEIPVPPQFNRPRAMSHTPAAAVKLPEPLGDRYEMALCCEQCFHQAKPGPGGAVVRPHEGGVCSRSYLAFRPRKEAGLSWQLLRRRPPCNVGRDFQTCRFFMVANHCKGGPFECTFAHNELECYLWTMDRAGKFSLADLYQRCSNLPSVGASPDNQQKPASATTNQMPQQSTKTTAKATTTTNGMTANSMSKKFPLAETHNCALACSGCLKPLPNQHGMYCRVKTDSHECKENMFIVHYREALLADGAAVWVRVRVRPQHDGFLGQYNLCWDYTHRPPKKCHFGEEACRFAHNKEEIHLWTLDRKGDFNISEFMDSLRTRKVSGPTVQEMYSRFGGTLQFFCKQCYHHGRISRVASSTSVCSLDAQHVRSAVLAHGDRDTVGQVTYSLIYELPHIKSANGQYLVCWHGKLCAHRRQNKCRFAHSDVEQHVWRYFAIARSNTDKLVEEWQALHSASLGPSSSVEELPAPVSASPDKVPLKPQITELGCPYDVDFRCHKCFVPGGQLTPRDSKSKRCTSKNAHSWNMLSEGVCIIFPSKKRICTRPVEVSRYNLCRTVVEKRRCQRHNCTFAHSEEERNVWNWMSANFVESLEELVAVSRQHHAQRDSTSQTRVAAGLPSAGSAWAPLPKVHAVPLPSAQTGNAFYCEFCRKECTSARQWQEHCASQRHEELVNTDKDRQWNYRQPPWGAHTYRLCAEHMDDCRCRYSNQPDIYNQCVNAHSQEELDEWHERNSYREMKKKMASERHMYSYVEDLLDDYLETSDPSSVMVESLPGVMLEMSETTVYLQDKHASHEWRLDVTPPADAYLEKVALLHNKDRLHFSLVAPSLDADAQIADGEAFDEGDGLYRVLVHFEAGMFGSFSQQLVMDFGSRPVLRCQLIVEVGARDVQSQVKRMREQLAFDRWTPANREIVRFEEEVEEDEYLLDVYKAPSSAEAVVTQELLKQELNRHNYEHHMRHLLQLEEFERSRIISSFNLKTTVEAVKVIADGNGLVNSQRGELFARVPLGDSISEDTEAGKLVLTTVTHVLLARDGDDKRVHEALIVNKERFDFEGKSRDFIYICFSPETVQELRIKEGNKLVVEIQFQMNRLYFCRMYSALDNLSDVSVAFPNMHMIKDIWNETSNAGMRSEFFNEQQLRALRYITARHTGYAPPLIIYGPFGTGKTETLAQCAAYLASSRPETRILICTHSNSAADMYVTRHLKRFAEAPQGGRSLRFCRVYFNRRRLNTVQPEILPHAFLNEAETGFRIPEREDLQQYQIVIITLETSFTLVGQEDMAGFFTHVMIDEAAQALEAEAIIPLVNASQGTCVVLAGDHKQMAPHVYSEQARKQLSLSLLHRLFRYYQAHPRATLPGNIVPLGGSPSEPELLSPFTVLLSTNYRSRLEITRFLSAVFYGGPDILVCRSTDKIPPLPALAFYTAKGPEQRQTHSTSVYNIAEVEEVVLRVNELIDNWPAEWGDKDPAKVAVVTPYADQVSAIRTALRQKSKFLAKIYVVPVSYVQGLEFYALFISTVRTVQARDEEHMGFLSDEKLLNTAMTRARGAVAVVGDPVALCSLGDCQVVWRTYLKHCEKLRALYPRSLSLEQIKMEVQSRQHVNTPLRTVSRSTQKLDNGAETGQGAVNGEAQTASWSEPSPSSAHESAAPADDILTTLKQTRATTQRAKKLKAKASRLF